MTPFPAYLFPGQGAQAVGMGVDLANAFPEARRVFDAGAEILGFDVLAICRDGPEDELNSTRVSQPAIFLHSMAALEVLSRRAGSSGPYGTGLGAAAACGLSLGEYSALVFVGALAFEEATELVGRRGSCMQEACEASRGAMASVIGLSDRRVEEVIESLRREGLEVGIANYNSPVQTVVSGREAAVEVAVERLREAGARRVVPLKVAGAFHSPLMASAARKLEPFLEKATIREPRLPFFANVSGRRVDDPDAIRRGLARQVESPVRWAASMRALLELGISSAFEVGPGRVLQGLARNVDRSLSVESVGEVEALDNLKVVPV